ncbi:carboxypeptidase-like regulatory domain-containing protein [Streptomyces sp. NPDC013457]|uniref:carboxypeptidase-like regulatory domain-containing protein n=1 Tax=Streptomyces sp. NPDC013457 TaxID=3364866 RepID=UPI0036F59E9F
MHLARSHRRDRRRTLAALTAAALVLPLTLAAAPAQADAATIDLTGIVTGATGAEAGAVVTASPSGATTTTGADGRYTLRLPAAGAYELAVAPAHRCASPATVPVEVAAGGGAEDVALEPRTDAFGTACSVTAAAEFPAGTQRLRLADRASGTAAFALPFPVPFYGRAYRSLTASVDGALSFVPPGGQTADGTLHAFGDDLTVDGRSGVYWAATGTAPHRKIVVEWRNVKIAGSAARERIGFAAVIGEDGTASLHYQGISGSGREDGSSATIGAESHTGAGALLYSRDEGTLRDGTVIALRQTRTAVILGRVTDANDRLPVVGARVGAYSGGLGPSGSADADGAYLFQVPASWQDYDVVLDAPYYWGDRTTVTAVPGSVRLVDGELGTGRVTADERSLRVKAPSDSRRTRTLTLTNTGGIPAAYSVAEKDGQGWLTVSPAGGGLEGAGQEPYDRTEVTVTVDTTGVAPGTVLKGTLRVRSDSGRGPVTDIPVTVIVRGHSGAGEAVPGL